MQTDTGADGSGEPMPRARRVAAEGERSEPEGVHCALDWAFYVWWDCPACSGRGRAKRARASTAAQVMGACWAIKGARSGGVLAKDALASVARIPPMITSPLAHHADGTAYYLTITGLSVREPINNDEAGASVASAGRRPIRAEGGATRGRANLSRRRAKGDWGLRAR